MTWRDLLHISLGHDGIEVQVGWVVVFGLLLIAAIYILVRYVILKRRLAFAVVEAEVELGGIGKITLRPSYEEVQIAHKAWTELCTRKAALPFDEQNDVIVEVYDSWYKMFGQMRDLVKEIPAQKLRTSSDTRKLVRLLVEALNYGLRPHLTRWQARFRRWYAAQLAVEKVKTPQEIQREYPEYAELVRDLKKVNEQVVEYGEFLKRIAQG
jgi:Na+-translocating ferredoxin:NAD+ oxidoreductase RnfD subunit